MQQARPRPQLPQLRIDAASVLQWYDRHARALPWRVPPDARIGGAAPDPYRIWLSEVMLQQTTVAAVGRYFERFTALWPTVADLARAPLEQVLAEWAGLGYYARARNLHACAVVVTERHGGVFPRTSAELLQLAGIGAYTAAAIAAISADERAAVLDGNVERVLARVLALPVPPATVRDELRAALQPWVPERAGDFAQALMDIGATICTPRTTLCMLCPLRDGCRGFAQGRTLAFPVKKLKAERPIRYGHAFVLRSTSEEVYLRRRPPTGLLGGMVEVPGSAWTEGTSAPDFPLAADWRACGRVVHVFTHFRLELEVWAASTRIEPALGGWWAAVDDLGSEALPTAFRKVLAAAGLG